MTLDGRGPFVIDREFNDRTWIITDTDSGLLARTLMVIPQERWGMEVLVREVKQ